MADTTESVLNGPTVSDDRLRDVIRKHLQRTISMDRSKTREEIANDSGVNVHTIDALLSRDPAKRRPLHAHQLLSLAWALDDRAVNAIMALIRYAATSLDGGVETPEPMRAIASLGGGITALAQAVGTGGFNHTNRPAVQEIADRMIDDLLPISSRGQS